MEEIIPQYLKESFEASSLTIVEIIQILTHHGIALPSARQRKAFYVELLTNSLEKYRLEWMSEFKKSKNPFQSFSQSPVVVSPLRKSPRRTPQKTPKATQSSNEFSTPVRMKSSESTPVSASPSVKTPYVVRTAKVPVVPVKPSMITSSFLYASILVLVVALIVMSQRLSFCDGHQNGACVPCPRFSKCSGREILSCTHPNWVKKRGWWMKDWNSYLILWPFNVEYCQDKSQDLAKEAKKLIKLGNMLNKVVRTWVGKAECGEIIQNDKNAWAWSKSNLKSSILGMPVSLAKEQLKSSLSTSNDVVFEELWIKLLENIMSSSKLHNLPLDLVLDDTHRQHRLVHSHSPPIHSMICHIKKSLLGMARRYSMSLISLGSLLAILTVIYTRRQASLREAIVINRLVEDIFDAIQQETHLHSKDKSKHPLPGLSLSQLKDHFLPLFSSRQRGLKPLDPISGFPCESDANDRRRWYLDELTRSRVWSRVYSTLGSNTLLKEVAMDVSGEGQSVLVYIGSHSLGWSSPKVKQSSPIVETF